MSTAPAGTSFDVAVGRGPAPLAISRSRLERIARRKMRAERGDRRGEGLALVQAYRKYADTVDGEPPSFETWKRTRAAEIYCPKCGHVNTGKFTVCPRCAAAARREDLVAAGERQSYTADRESDL